MSGFKLRVKQIYVSDNCATYCIPKDILQNSTSLNFYVSGNRSRYLPEGSLSDDSLIREISVGRITLLSIQDNKVYYVYGSIEVFENGVRQIIYREKSHIFSPYMHGNNIWYISTKNQGFYLYCIDARYKWKTKSIRLSCKSESKPLYRWKIAGVSDDKVFLLRCSQLILRDYNETFFVFDISTSSFTRCIQANKETNLPISGSKYGRPHPLVVTAGKDQSYQLICTRRFSIDYQSYIDVGILDSKGSGIFKNEVLYDSYGHIYYIEYRYSSIVVYRTAISWSIMRLLWIGRLKENSELCPLARLPTEIVKYLATYVE